ncbi:uronate isomerase [Lentisphaera araneosa HTCC2155]|uniref:Uronate isomerase n=1 Tax=Lentisphaera araneosa HTCC2155 TaxID=313628 RepID=A6DLV5_9BACT|nr:glucuronate isomerase [Lentisphaera araneosa]EDM27253.1 uronate isomerase [Lentisphaera araneosa HTCC2155]
MNFIHDDFVLENQYAKDLYHQFSKDQPIIDYHCHLIPQEIAEDRRWENITQIWLYGDHYKWRAMRSNGVDERFCTGESSDWEKFKAFADCMPKLLRNPLYHWTQLELKRYFNIDKLLGPDTAEEIWNEANKVVQADDFSARQLMVKSKVKLVCTTDDPIDDLRGHKQIAADQFQVKVLPTWRPDKAMAVDQSQVFTEWYAQLQEITDFQINSFDDYLKALKIRQDYFHENGCRLSDHGINEFYASEYSDADIAKIFDKARSGEKVSEREDLQFKSCMMYHFGLWNHEKGWVQQFHYGAIRNNNTRMYNQLGPDTGFDSIGSPNTALAMSRYFDRLDSSDQLAKSIIYNLNPGDNHVIGTMIGNFQDGSAAGKMQFGSGWWFLDQKDGMENQIEALSQLGSLSQFVGMLTDSRSFLSYTRHEYFRRILCNILGKDMEKGLVPADLNLVGPMIADISYNNAANYFDFNL